MAAEVLLTILASIAALVAVALAYRLAQASRQSLDVAERAVREELRIGRDEAAKASSELRGEVTSQLKGLSDSNEQRLDRLRATLDTQLDAFTQGDGLIPGARKQMTEQATRLTDSIANMQDRLAIRRAALQREFIAADAAMSQLQSQTGSIASFGSSL